MYWLSGCLWISPEEHATRRDFDGDGVPAPTDCNDTNLHIAPGLPEIACNLTDDDCDPDTADGPAFSVAVTFPTIQMALDLAAPGAEIGLCAGTYTEALTLRRDGVTLSGNPDLPSILSTEQREGVASVTVLGADNRLRLLEIRGGTGNDRDGVRTGGVIDATDAAGDLTLEDVVVHGGTADVGAGIVAPALYRLVLTRSVVRDNVATDLGGGVYAEGGVVLDGAEITANAASTGGGMWIGGSATVDAVGSRVVGNGATDGAGLYVAGDVFGLEVRDNDAADRGGGVLLDQGDLVDVVCADNVADRGGGVAGTGTVTRGTIEANLAGEGGGLWFSDAGTLVGVTVRGNTATTGPGGGVYALGELVVTDDPSSAVSTRIESNTAADRGGGLAIDGAGFRVTRAVVTENSGDIGGGLAAYGICGNCDANLLQDVQFVANRATDGAGWYTEVDLTAAELVVTDNVATGRGGGAFVYGGEVNDTFGAYERNSADVGGGLAWSGRGVLAQASIVGNTADEGGGLALESGADLDASQVTFAGNITGGAVLSGTGGQASLSTVWFDENTGYSFRVCDQPCTAASAAVDYLGGCEFPSPGCDEVPGFCAEPVPDCP